MRSFLCVTMLFVWIFALQCTADNEILEGQMDDQSSGVPRTTAVTTKTTKEPQQIPSDAEVSADHLTPAIPDVSAPSEKTTTTVDAPTQKSPIQPSSTDQQDRQGQQQPQLQQAHTGDGSGVKTKEHSAEIQPKVDNPPNQHATQSEPDVKTPDAQPSPQTPPALSSSGKSKQQQSQQSQQSQTPATNISLTGEKSQDAIGDASHPGKIATPTTTTAAATEKRNEDSKEATTTTVAPTLAQSIVPTTTSNKRSTLSQSVDKKDGSRNTSLLFALAILFTLAVIPVAPEF